MSRKNKKKNKSNKEKWNAGVTEQSVCEAINQQNSKKALDLAKIFVKENPGKRAESLLAQSYELRIKQLKESGLVEDAKQLILVAKSKCSDYKDRFDSIQKETFQYPLSLQDISQIITLLNSNTCNEETRDRLNEILKTKLAAPSDLLECPELPVDSSLKQEGFIIKSALEAVAGDFDEDVRKQRVEMLSKVSRRSPLAPWCFFIRALDAYHCSNDADCKTFLSRIPDGSTLTPAKLLLQSKLDQNSKPEGLSSRPTRTLWKTLTPDSPRHMWRNFVNTAASRNKKAIREKIKTLLQSDWITTPIILREVIRSILQKLNNYEMLENEFLDILKNKLEFYYGAKTDALFYLDIANSMGDGFPEDKLDGLELFLDHWEGILSEKEEAAICAKAGEHAMQEESFPPSPFAFLFSRRKKNHSNSIRLYKRACQLHPHPDYFQPLVSLMKKNDEKPTVIEKILVKWRRVCPNDCIPLIYMFEAAEDRGALQKALNYLEEAEQLDPLNATVRHARERLVWHMIVKHLKQRKYHLVEKDLKQVNFNEMTPSKKSFFEGIKRFLTILRDEYKPGTETYSLYDALLFRHLDLVGSFELTARLDQIAPLPELDSEEKFGEFYSLKDLCLALKEPLKISKKWYNQIPKWIYKLESISEELLLRISSRILIEELSFVVIAATARGLNLDSPKLPEFLYYRALALWEDSHRYTIDVERCLRAVITLCRAKGNYDLERQAVDSLKSVQETMYDFFFEPDQVPKIEMPDYEIKQVIQEEKDRTAPKSKRKTKHKVKKKQPAQKSVSEVKTNLENNRELNKKEEEEIPIEDMKNTQQELLW